MKNENKKSHETNNIILFPEVEVLKEDIERTRTELSMLMLECDELQFVICKNIETEYMLKLGSLEYKAYESQCKLMRLKRKIDLIQARKNRQEAINLTVIDTILDEEFAEYQEQLNKQIDKMNEALERNTGKLLTEEESKELKKLYRKIVKVLHPDINKSLNSSLLKLFDNAMEAYKNGDLQSLQIIAEIVVNNDISNNHTDTFTKLKEEKERLEKMCSEIIKSIEDIKKEYPYTLKDILDDEKKLKKRKLELEDILKSYNETIVIYEDKVKKILEVK